MQFAKPKRKQGQIHVLVLVVGLKILLYILFYAINLKLVSDVKKTQDTSKIAAIKLQRAKRNLNLEIKSLQCTVGFD